MGYSMTIPKNAVISASFELSKESDTITFNKSKLEKINYITYKSSEDNSKSRLHWLAKIMAIFHLLKKYTFAKKITTNEGTQKFTKIEVIVDLETAKKINDDLKPGILLSDNPMLFLR